MKREAKKAREGRGLNATADRRQVSLSPIRTPPTPTGALPC